MKRVLIALFCVAVFAAPGLADKYDSWRSTTTSTPAYDVLICSSAVLLYKVIANTPGTESYIDLYNGRIESATSKVGPHIDTTFIRDTEYGVIFSSGLRWTNYGTVQPNVTITYEILFPKPGDEGVGY